MIKTVKKCREEMEMHLSTVFCGDTSKVNNDNSIQINTESLLYLNTSWLSFFFKKKNSFLYDENLNNVHHNNINYIVHGTALALSETGSYNSKIAERSKSVLEIISSNQWFINISSNKDMFLKAANEINWHPISMKKKIEQWILGIDSDWCISRQRYFGVPFPVWYSKRKGEEGKIIIADMDKVPINPLVDLPNGYTKEEVEGDLDVMDTWATSSLTPQMSAQGVSKEFCINKKRFESLYPADLRSQSHEIIRTWAFYTIVKSKLHAEVLPWKNIMISGWCLAEDKEKMSKSLNNIIDPLKMLETYGSDAMRYWASTSTLGTDTVFSEKTLKEGTKLCIKLWNAAKFADLHIKDIDIKSITFNANYLVIDKYIILRLSEAIKKWRNEFINYRYFEAIQAINDFFWKDFCDHYVEIIKSRIYGNFDDIDNNKKSNSAKISLCISLLGILRAFSPFIPNITDFLFRKLFGNDISIHDHKAFIQQNIPFDINNIISNGSLDNQNFTEDIINKIHLQGKFCFKFVDIVRSIKAKLNISMKEVINNVLIYFVYPIEIAECEIDLKSVCSIKKITYIESNKDFMELHENYEKKGFIYYELIIDEKVICKIYFDI